MWHKDTIEWVDIELTSYCNIDCPGCLRQQMHKEVGHILNQSYVTLDDLKKSSDNNTPSSVPINILFESV